MRLTPEGHSATSQHLSSLGNALYRRFGRLGSIEDLDEAIESHEKAVGLTPDNSSKKPARVYNLAIALNKRFQRLGALRDLESSVSNQQLVLQLTPDSHPNKALYLSGLGDVLLIRFDRLRNLEDVESAISSMQRAAHLTPDGHMDKPRRLINLGTTLVTRFDRLGTLEDLENAVSNHQKAVDLTPDDHPDKASLFNSLGSVLQARFGRLKHLEDIESAISYHQRAVQLTPNDHPDKSHALGSLGLAFVERFERLDAFDDLESAISNQQMAVQLMPDGHSYKPGRLSNLGNTFQRRFNRLGNIKDLESALSNLQMATQLTPEGHPDKPLRLYNLGITHQSRFEQFKDPEALINALSNFQQAATSPTGTPKIRFHASLRWAQCAEALSVSPIPACKSAIDLIPRIAWLGVPVTDQHSLLAEIGIAVRNIVASAIRHQEYESAVEWAEQGRSIIWQNLLSLRTPLDRLRQNHPELANRLQEISLKLENPLPHEIVSDMKETPTAGNIAQSYSKLAIEWEKIVEKIRLIPEFQAFLRPRSLNELAPAANEGPVIILNDYKLHVDALVLIPEDSASGKVSVVNIPLEGFTSQVGKKLYSDLTSHLVQTGARAQGTRKSNRVQETTEDVIKFEDILRQLWLRVVKPVIDGLAYQARITPRN